jgi:hypothetical protein
VPTITTPLIAAALALALAGLAASACSDDAAALTVDEWRTQADAVCAAGNERAEAAYASVGEHATDAAVARLYVEELLPNIRQQVDELDGLQAPAAIRDDVDGLLGAAREALVVAEEIGADELLGATDPFLEVSSRAQSLGLRNCGDR